MFPSLLRRLALVCCLPLAAHATSLVSLKATPLTSPGGAASPAPVSEQPYSFQGQVIPLGVELRGQAIPGLDRALIPLLAAAQDGRLYVVVREAGGSTRLLRYDAKAGWQPRADPPGPVFPAAFPVGQSHLFFVRSVPATGQMQLLAYHTITNTWPVIGEWASPGAIESVVRTTEGFVVTTREAHAPGHAVLLTLTSAKRSLGWIDWTIIIVYLAGTAGIGLYFYLKEKKGDNNEFFLGGRTIPWWAAGVSLYATGTSAISFIAIPAKSFATNWLYLAAPTVGIFGTIFVAIWVVPLIRLSLS
jgi:SSS family solute:Na+ symporter